MKPTASRDRVAAARLLHAALAGTHTRDSIDLEWPSSRDASVRLAHRSALYWFASARDRRFDGELEAALRGDLEDMAQTLESGSALPLRLRAPLYLVAARDHAVGVAFILIAAVAVTTLTLVALH